ncbi:tRNA (32-2'-O)-methyltransferase regulator THADA [Gastrophryne carolinensis]
MSIFHPKTEKSQKMVLKKKKEVKVDALTLGEASLERLKSVADGKDDSLASLLLQCLQLQDGVQQIHHIKKLVPLLETPHSSVAGTAELRCSLGILAEMFLTVSSKNPLKRVLASVLSGLPDPCKEAAISAFTDCLRRDIAAEEPESYRRVVDNLASCMENFRLGSICVMTLLPEALRFLVKVLNSFQHQNKKVLGDGLVQTQLMHDLLTAVKLAMVLLQKSQESIGGTLEQEADPVLWKAMCDLLSCFSSILLDDDLLQNVQSTSGMAVILYLKTMVQDCEKCTELVSGLILRSLNPADAPDWLIHCCAPLYRDLPDIALLFLCQGVLAMIQWRDGKLGKGGEALLLDLLTVLLSLSSCLRESSSALFLSRILALWTTSALDLLHSCSKNLQESLNGSSSTMCRLLEYVYVHWEHPLDAVRHQTKQIFKNILHIHHVAAMGTSNGEVVTVDPFLSELSHKLLNLEWHSKGKYASLACLVESVGAEQILAVDDTIPQQILDVMWDQSFAPYAANLLEAMFVNHKKQLLVTKESCWIERWHNVWVTPLLRRLCDEHVTQTTYIIDYYLSKLLKCNSESINYMIDQLQSSAATRIGTGNNRGALGALMACLRTARAHGHLRFTENYAWTGRVSIGLIQQGLVHRHDQIRLDALGLLCESHWSTEVLSLDEMNLLHFFLQYNLNCQAPAVRQQLCYLLKKLFCRLQESSQVLYKHQQSKKYKGAHQAEGEADPDIVLKHYTEFMSSVTDYLFGSLFPGSSHPTRFTALTILISIAEIFPLVPGSCQSVFQFAQSVSSSHVHALLECFSNTFEEVKLLAFELLRKLPPSALGLQDPGKLLELFQAAMNLSTSTKHFDCVTASYIMKFLICQEGLQAALGDWTGKGQNTVTLDHDSASLMERNTLIVVRLLSDSLEREIRQAENSLLEAAASFPLYGRVHCIIGALEQLSLGNVLAVEEWRKLVSLLIALCYRLSAIVSPVVHSSSPEGLMPMDTESEAAAQLHMIMSEIKPRDTNDFFTQPRILQKDTDLHSQALPEDCAPANTMCAEMKDNKGTSCNVTAQMVLVCCWRSMKEVSLLLGFLCQSLPLQTRMNCPQGLITVEQVKEMGDYFKHHLLQSRHRGAFELAYVGFAKLTDILTRCKEESLRSLPRQWLCNVLEEIKSSDPSSRLCATRRSAGIPFYIQALLTSEPKNSKAGLLKMTMKELISLALPSSDLSGNNSTIPQVHALNILRAIFRDTRLGESIMPYVGDGTQAAVLGFTSPVWAVRNSSTLLFSTLITRIFGVKRGKDEHSKKNRMTGREFFSRFPNLYPFLLEQLEAVANTVDSSTGEAKLHPSLYLLLLILSKLYPSPMDGTYALSMAPFIPFIMRCANSPVYRSREMAARALVPFLMVDSIPCTAVSLINSLPDEGRLPVRQNHVHGVLLQVFYLLQSFFEAKHTTNSGRLQQEGADITDSLKAKMWLAKRQNPCLVTRATFTDILTTIGSYLLKDGHQGSGFWEEVQSVTEDCDMLRGSQHAFSDPGLVQYMQSITRLLLLMLNKQECTSDGQGESAKILNPSLVQNLLMQEFYEVRALTLESVLQWMNNRHGGTVSLLSPEVEETIFKMTTKENNLECLCQVLKVLYEIDTENLLAMAEQKFQMESRDFLRKILNLVSTTSNSVEIQGSALKLSSRLVVSLAGKNWEATESELKEWVTLMVHCCGDELQTEVKLAAAEILVDVTPHLLTNQLPVLGVPDTLQLWKCVLQLLQSEDPDVRDAAVDIIRVYHAQKNSVSERGFLFSSVSPPMALDLTLGVICELLQQWNQVPVGVPVLLEWLLGEDDLSDLEPDKTVEDDYLFEKGEANFWAEKLVYIRLLAKHLGELIDSCSILPDPKILQISQAAQERSEKVQQLFSDLPPTPQFLRTSDYTRLLIHKERASRCLEIVNMLPTSRES